MAVTRNKKFTRTVCRRFRCRSSRTGNVAQSGVPVVTQGLADLQKAAQAAGIPATKQAFEDFRTI